METMKHATYLITTENGVSRTWNFTEVHSEGDYGNGNYIVVTRGEEVIAYLDMRYAKYVFGTVCENYIRDYFGTNLYSYERR